MLIQPERLSNPNSSQNNLQKNHQGEKGVGAARLIDFINIYLVIFVFISILTRWKETKFKKKSNNKKKDPCTHMHLIHTDKGNHKKRTITVRLEK